MEFHGHKTALMYLLTNTSMVIKTYITDRHGAISKWMKEICPQICKEIGKVRVCHMYDRWHVAKSIWKALNKKAKEKDGEIITRWIKACLRHFQWSVTTTEEGQHDVILAKFQSFLSHICNKHSNFPNKIFDKCAHENLDEATPRAWFIEDSIAHERVTTVLTKKSLNKVVAHSSPHGQTSCLEGYHSVVNQFAPKMLAYSYNGMLSRTILAALHFNYNLNREAKRDNDQNIKLRVTYPKFKNGEGTVREVRQKQNFSYVGEIFSTLISTNRKDLEATEKKLKEDVPEPVHTMFEKQDKSDCIHIYKSRKAKQPIIVPPTCPPATLTENNGLQGTQRQRKAPECKKCKQPMKGHKKGQCSTSSDTQ